MTRRTLLGGLVSAIATFARPAWARQASFGGRAAGEARTVDAIDLCWCPPGRFVMGSPRSEPERRPGEDQVEVTLDARLLDGEVRDHARTLATCRRRVAGSADARIAGRRRSPGGQRQLCGDGRLLPSTHRTQSKERRASRGLGIPSANRSAVGYACRAGTTTATSFGDSLSSTQANFKGKPYNGGEPGPSLNRAAPVGSYPANRVGSSRHARQHIRVVSRLVSLAAAGRNRSRSLCGTRHRAAQRARRHFPRAAAAAAGRTIGWPCRSAFRVRFEPDRRYDHIGFRVVAVQL